MIILQIYSRIISVDFDACENLSENREIKCQNWDSIWSTSYEESVINAFLQPLKWMIQKMFVFTFFINLSFFPIGEPEKPYVYLSCFHTKTLFEMTINKKTPKKAQNFYFLLVLTFLT
jgi:hypothetical protein